MDDIEESLLCLPGLLFILSKIQFSIVIIITI